MRRKGHKPTYRTFDTQAEAQKWAHRIEAEIDTGFYVDNSAAEKMILGEAVKQYKRDVAAKKRHPSQENGHIDRWLRNELCFRTLANLQSADFARYRDQRRTQGRAENTIRLELQLVSHLYEIARKKWGHGRSHEPFEEHLTTRACKCSSGTRTGSLKVWSPNSANQTLAKLSHFHASAGQVIES